MTAPIFTGVGVALVTIFDSSGELDAGATSELANRLVEAGIRCVVVAGSNGEAASLEVSEHAGLVKAVRAALPPDIVVLAGSGAPSARQAAHLTRVVLDAGADAVLVLSPPQSSDPRPYYETVAKAAGGASVLGYHFPSVSSPGLAVGALADLPIAGLKDSSGDARRMYETLEVFSGWFYTGSANLVLLAGALGCGGAILGIANLEPEMSVRAFAGDAGAQRQLVARASALSAHWPHGLKEAVAARYGTSATARMG